MFVCCKCSALKSLAWISSCLLFPFVSHAGVSIYQPSRYTDANCNDPHPVVISPKFEPKGIPDQKRSPTCSAYATKYMLQYDRNVRSKPGTYSTTDIVGICRAGYTGEGPMVSTRLYELRKAGKIRHEMCDDLHPEDLMNFEGKRTKLDLSEAKNKEALCSEAQSLLSKTGHQLGQDAKNITQRIAESYEKAKEKPDNFTHHLFRSAIDPKELDVLFFNISEFEITQEFLDQAAAEAAKTGKALANVKEEMLYQKVVDDLKGNVPGSPPYPLAFTSCTELENGKCTNLTTYHAVNLIGSRCCVPPSTTTHAATGTCDDPDFKVVNSWGTVQWLKAKPMLVAFFVSPAARLTSISPCAEQKEGGEESKHPLPNCDPGIQGPFKMKYLAEAGDVEQIKAYGRAHPDQINQRNPHGIHPLGYENNLSRSEVVAAFLEMGVDKDTETKDGFSLLSTAAASGYDSTVKLLLENKATVDHRAKDGTTPLYSAAKNGKVESAKLLIAAGADIMARNPQGITPFHQAAWEGHVAVLEAMVASGKQIDMNARTTRGSTPLLLAAQDGKDSAVKFLIDHHVDLEKPRNDGFTPLAAAVEKGHFTTARLLLEAGANPLAVSKNGKSILDLAKGAPKNSQKIADLVSEYIRRYQNREQDRELSETITVEEALKKDQDGNIFLHRVATDPDPTATRRVVDLLLGPHPDRLHEKNNQGDTPLHVAARAGNLEVVQYLESKLPRDRVNERNKRGETPLRIAAEQGNLSIVKYLATKRPEAVQDFIKIGSKGVIPLNRLAAKGHWDVFLFLINQIQQCPNEALQSLRKAHVLERAREANRQDVVMALQKIGVTESVPNTGHLKDASGSHPLFHKDTLSKPERVADFLADGVNKDIEDKNGWTPLVFAAANGHAAAVKILLEHKATVDREDKEGRTPLFWAGNRETAELLLEYGANVNHKSKKGWTPLSRVASAGKAEVAKALIAAGADIMAPNAEGVTPFHDAAWAGHAAVLEAMVASGKKIDMNAQTNIGNTPLQLAAQAGKDSSVKFLIDHHVDIDKPKNDGYTPLAKAVENGHFITVKLLLEAGANPSAVAKDGESILDLAKGAPKDSQKIADLVSEYIRRYQNREPNRELSKTITVEEALKKDPDGNTFLHRVATDPDWTVTQRVVKLLVGEDHYSKEKYRLYEKNKQGDTPLHVAAKAGNLEVVQYLEFKLPRDRANERNKQGKTPLLIAAEQGNLSIVKYLATKHPEAVQDFIKIGWWGGDLPLKDLLLNERWNVFLFLARQIQHYPKKVLQSLESAHVLEKAREANRQDVVTALQKIGVTK